MTVIDASLTSHTISIIPRVYNADNAHNFIYIDNDTKVETTVSGITKALNDGRIDYTLSLTTTEGKDYSFKIVHATTTNIIFRGNLLATGQTTQNYSING